MEWSYVLAGLCLSVFVIRYHLMYTYRHWKKQSIPCIEGTLPGFGNMFLLIAMKKNMSQLYEDFYNKMREYSMVGFYDMRTPRLLIRDPELVKTVLVKDFHSFHHNDSYVDLDIDPLNAANPFFNYGAQWKTSRGQLHSTFTSSKLKFMFGSVSNVCSKMSNYLNKKMEERGDKLELELKDLFSKYMEEVVTNLAFGVESESFSDDQDRPFRKVTKAMFEPSLMQHIKQMSVQIIPFLDKFSKIRILPLNVDRFFRQVIKDVLSIRERQNVERNDFLQSMMRLRKSGAKDCVSGMEFNEDSITAHATTLFDEGYGSSSVALSFIGYLLATHPHVQQRLRDEVNVVALRHDILTYEAIGEMTYMDQVISEALRIYSPTGVLMKVCTKGTDLIGRDGLTCHVEPGTNVVISIQGLHKDPLFWPNPEEFDPDRFSAECKRLRHKFVYLPFSEGPRICVGKRVACMLMKAAIATIVRNYVLESSPRTKLPLQINPKHQSTTAKDGLWVYLNPV